MKAATKKFITWLMGLTVIMRYFVIAVLFHVALLVVLASIKIVAIVPAIVASFTDTPLPPPANLNDVPEDPFAAYRDYDYKGPDLGAGGGTGQKGPGGTPTAGNTAAILQSDTHGETPAVAEVIGVMSDTATAITRPSVNPGGVGLESMGGMGGLSGGTPGVKGPGGPWLGIGRMGPRRAVNLARHGGSAATERAVLAALRWLKANQKPNGSWDCAGGGDTAGPALAALAFLGHGETVDSPEFGPTIQKTLEFLVKAVPPQGVISGGMYCQALVTFALAEGYAMTGSPALKAPLDRATKVIVEAQKVHKEKSIYVGGWRYSPWDTTSDLSVSGWQIMALKSAINAGVEVPHETMEGALKFVWASYGKPGFGYSGPGTTPTMSAVGCLCAQFLGHGDDERVTTALHYLRDQKIEWDTVGGSAMYFIYYCTQAMFQGGDNYWPKWNDEIRNLMVKNQAPDGHWPCPPKSGEIQAMDKTPVYATALGALVLETYYRFLPMYEVLKKEKQPAAGKLPAPGMP